MISFESKTLVFILIILLSIDRKGEISILNVQLFKRFSFSAFRSSIIKEPSYHPPFNHSHEATRKVLDIGLGIFSVEFRNFSINVGLIASARTPSYLNIGVLTKNHYGFPFIPLIGIR